MADIIPMFPDGRELDGPADEVLAKLRLAAGGSVRKTLSNFLTILRHDPRWRGRIGMDTFARCLTLDGRPLEGHDFTAMRMDLGDRYEVEPSKAALKEIVALLGKKNRYSSVHRWLEGVAWDGTLRLSGWLTSAFGVEDTKLHRAFARRFAISAVARAFEPGCKVDTILLLVGGQGVGKSTVFRLLAGDGRFSDTELKVGSKDAFVQLGQAWIYEVAEMTSFTGVRADRIKGFVSSTVDKFRPPYSSAPVEFRRQTVFVATTNEDRPLDDPTGSRRFWPVAISKPLVQEWLRDNRDQLWAEAVAAYKAGEQWHLTGEEEDLRVIHNRQFEQVDPWTPSVEAWAAGQDGPFTIRQCIEGALGVPGPGQDRGHQNRVGAILRQAGFAKRKARRGEVPDGTRPWLWARGES